MDRDIIAKRAVVGGATRLGENAVAKEKAAILTIMEELGYMLDLGHSNMSTLEEKLHPVTMQIPEDPATEDDHEYAGSSSLYEMLHSYTRTLRSLNRRIVSARNKLEV